MLLLASATLVLALPACDPDNTNDDETEQPSGGDQNDNTGSGDNNTGGDENTGGEGNEDDNNGNEGEGGEDNNDDQQGNPNLPEGAIELTNNPGGLYFGDFWDEGIADYYFLLSDDTQFGQTEEGFDVPMTPGCYLLFIDLWGAVSADHTNPIVPEGTYEMGTRRGMNVMTQELTLVTLNKEKVGNQYRIVDYFFKDGTLVVTHKENQEYIIDAQFVTTDDEEMHFYYEGPIVMDDKSDDEEFDPFIKEDIEMEPVKATTYLFDTYENCERHVLMLFDNEEITADGIHVNGAGHKLQLSLFNELGEGLVGTFTPGTVQGNGVMVKEPGVFYPGRMISGNIASGTFIEKVADDGNWTITNGIPTDGTIEISKNDDGTYNVVAELYTPEGVKVSCDWTGQIGPHNPQSAE